MKYIRNALMIGKYKYFGLQSEKKITRTLPGANIRYGHFVAFLRLLASHPGHLQHVPRCQAELLIARDSHLLAVPLPLVGDQALHIGSILDRIVRLEFVPFSIAYQHHLLGPSFDRTGGDTFHKVFLGWYQLLMGTRPSSFTPETEIGAEVVPLPLEADISWP